ncbi:hypothetical protein NYP20_13465 [Pseudomonas sp. N3-W]|uniref:Uncharacterized protein n=1 Tax=Pseudomonas fungipugnans TaxID=3024217 RepID=A0ABT6QJG5_9PSED|nr:MULTISPECIES: hypothetical protein [unclassified Pseudomonas]MDI2590387.1 hypothetical protein [Pseudomonas sp. 681]UWF51911.1 hypothetical protein NYP20_13465 [Pseudomonas sp. N3-W]
MKLITPPKLLMVAAVVELATGFGLLLAPGVVSSVLLGIAGTEVTNLFARFFGIALIALGVACWPSPATVAALRSMQVYNGAIALYLAYIGVFVSSGLLLWPAVVFHGVMTVLLLRR